MEPIYLTGDPATYAEGFKQRLIALGFSKQYAERARRDIVKRAVQVANSYEANQIQCGRA